MYLETIGVLAVLLLQQALPWLATAETARQTAKKKPGVVYNAELNPEENSRQDSIHCRAKQHNHKIGWHGIVSTHGDWGICSLFPCWTCMLLVWSQSKCAHHDSARAHEKITPSCSQLFRLNVGCFTTNTPSMYQADMQFCLVCQSTFTTTNES